MSKIYLLYGEEKYDLNRKIESIKKEFNGLEIGLNLFYINKDNIDELENISQGVTFFGTKKLVIIKNMNLKINLETLQNADDDITFIIIENNIDKRLSEYKRLSKVAEISEFKHLDSKQMTDYIYNIIKKYSLNISYDNASYIQNLCGEDKTNIINELKKIVIYLDSNDRNVTREIIDKVCARTLNAKIFDVLNLIVNKKREEATKSLNDLLEQKEPIIKIYIMLYKQIYQMYIIKYAKLNNIPDISKLFNIHPYTYKNLLTSSDKYSLSQLKQILTYFDEYDEKTKNGEMDFEIGLKKIICSM